MSSTADRVRYLEAALLDLLDRQRAAEARETDLLKRIRRLEEREADRTFAAAMRLLEPPPATLNRKGML